MPLHQFTPGVQAPFGFQPTVPYPVDSWSGPYSAGSTTAAVSLANSTVPDAIRFLSLEVRILAPNPGSPGQTLAYKYWYRGSTANDGLVEFSSASSTDSGVTLAVAGAGIVLSPAGGTGTVTFINNGVLSFNGKTGAVTGASLGANTFSELNTFNAGITTAFIYASNGSTFGGTLQVNGGTTLGARVDVVGVLDVGGGVTMESTLDVVGVAKFVNGVTFQSTTDHGGVARFAAGLTTSALDVQGVSKFNGNITLGDAAADTITATGTFQGLTVSNGLLIANAGITTAFLYASTGSTFGSTLRVNGGATFGARVDVGGVLQVAGGVTLEQTLNVISVAKFNSNVILGDETTDSITATGTFLGLTSSGGIIANAGITTAFIYASTGSTFAGTLKVVGGATFDSTTDHGGVARFTAGLTTSTLDVQAVSKFAGGATFASSANFAVGLTSAGDVVVGSAGTVFKTNGDATIGATLTVNGNFFVAGTLTTVNQTTLQIDDKTITLGRTLDNDNLADGGGLILNASPDRTLLWNSASDAWTSSVNYNVATGYGYKVNNTTALASGMVHGLSASAGIITGGTWEANSIGLTYGGTNKNLSGAANFGVVYKDADSMEVTAAGTSGQILKSNGAAAPTWIDVTSLSGLTAAKVKTTATNIAGTYFLTFVTAASDSTDLFVDTTTGVTYDANTGLLSCTQLEALVDGGTF